MLFSRKTIALSALVGISMLGSVKPSAAEWIEQGDEKIDGTSVHTMVYHERGYAVFSNSCGSQQLTQSQLQGGAKPTNIIPCPRPGSTTSNQPSAPYTGKRLWAAVAAGIESGFLGMNSRVSAGFAKDYSTRAEAEAGAIASCQKNISSCKAVGAWNAGCYYITVSKNADNVAWGSGPTAQDAYNSCYSRVKGGNCDTNTLGGCYPQ